jgi:hypothetical protein
MERGMPEDGATTGLTRAARLPLCIYGRQADVIPILPEAAPRQQRGNLLERLRS